MRPSRRHLRRSTAVGLACLGFTLFPGSVASAHAVFVAAGPAPGATLQKPPKAVRIEFSEPLNAPLSGIRLYTSSGRPVALKPAEDNPRDPRAYVVGVPRLRPDRYTVVWHTVSAIDGHTRRGSYVFTVARPDGSVPHVARSVPIGLRSPPHVPVAAPAAARWCGLGGLFLVAGSVLVAMLCAGGTEIPGLRRRLWPLLVAGAGMVVVGAAGDLVSSWAPTGWGEAALGSLLTSSAGRWAAIRVAAVTAVVVMWPRAARPEPRWVHVARGVGVAGAALSFAASGHGAASAWPALGLGFEFAHVLASSVWLGGAIAVAVAYTVARRHEPAARRTLLHRYSVVAGVAVPAVLATGLGNALVELGATDDVVRSSYGASLLVKLVAVLVLLGIAAVNAVVLRPADAAGRIRGRRLRYTIATEAALGVAVLVPTAVMGVLAPPRPIDQARTAAGKISANSDPAHAFSGVTRLQGREVEVTMTPGAVGSNAVRIEVAGVYPASGLRLSATGPGGRFDVGLAQTGHDHDSGTHTIYQGSVRLAHAGTWQAVVRRAGFAASLPMVLPVSAPIPGLPASSPADGLERWLAVIALAGGAVAIGALTRADWARRLKAGALALGGAGLTAALAWVGVLVVPAEQTLAAGQSAGWGVARKVHPATLPAARVWRMPTPGAGLMTPAVAADGSVWVAEMDANKLARLDPRGNVVREFRFPGHYRETMGIAIADTGRVWIAQEHAMALGMFDPAAGRYREFRIPGGVSAPVGIAVGPHGDVWFTEMSGNKIGRFDPGTLRFSAYRIPTPNATPYWLAVAPHGDVWFTEFGTGKVGVLDPQTGRIREYAAPGEHPNVPGIAVGNNGTVWFTTTQGSLFELAPSSGRMRRIPLPAAGDYGVAVAPHGTVWVGRQGGGAAYAVNAASGAVRAVRLPAGSAPWWPTVDSHGRVWVALAGDRGNGLAVLQRSS